MVDSSDMDFGAGTVFIAPEEFTDLQKAASDGNLREVLSLLEGGAVPDGITSDCSFTPLYFAAGSGNPDVVRALIRAGADVNLKCGVFGWPPLHAAASPEIVRILVEAGADVNGRSDSGRTALYRFQSREQAEALIAAGADVNARDSDGDTPFSYAMSYGVLGCGWYGIVHALLSAGADITVKEMEVLRSLLVSEKKRAAGDLAEAEALLAQTYLVDCNIGRGDVDETDR